MNSLLLASLLAAGAAPGDGAAAKDQSVLLVVLGDGEGGLAAEGRAEFGFLRALQQVSVDAVDIDARFPPPGAEDLGKALEQAGREAYDNLDLELAREKLQGALAFYEGHPGLSSAPQLSRLTSFLGAIELQEKGRKGQKAARELLTLAQLLDPELQLDPTFFGADSRQLFEQAKADLAQRARASLKVSTTPAGAQVFFRGRLWGVTPVPEIDGLEVGRHFVRFHRPGFAAEGAIVDVSAQGAEVALELQATPAWAALKEQLRSLSASDTMAAKVPVQVAEAAKASGARFIAVARVTAASEGAFDAQLTVYDTVSAGRLSGVAFDGTAPSLAAAAQGVKTWLGNPSPVVPMVATSREPGGLPPVLKKWWFWAAVGGAVVAGTTVALAASAQPAGRPYNVVLDLP